MEINELGPDEIGAMPLVWAGYIIRPCDRKFSNYQDFPNTSGIYAMYTAAGDLTYIGRSVAIHSRLRQHARTTFFWGGDPSLYSYREVPEVLCSAIEVAHIKALQPIENQFTESGGYEWLQRLMTPAIECAWRDVRPAQAERIDALYGKLAEQIASRL